MISVCMPYWNRPRELTRSMNAYAKAYPDWNLEFSICDDGSFTPLEFPGAVITRLPQHSRALNPCVPINAAVRASSSAVIVITNPEVEHREPVLQQMLAMLEGPNDYVTVACKEATTGEWIAGPNAPKAPVGGRRPIPEGSDLHFCAMMYRELFDRVGGFDEEYRFGLGCEDNDWLWTLHEAGVNFKRAPGTVWHYRTPHRAWKGTVETNSAILERKFGHLEKFKCAS